MAEQVLTETETERVMSEMERLDRLMDIILRLSHHGEPSDGLLTYLQSSLLKIWMKNFNKQFPVETDDESLAEVLLNQYLHL